MADKFEYEYEAFTLKEKEEIQSIQSRYLPKSEKEQKLQRLRELDKKTQSIPAMISISLGIVSILIFGLGMTFFLKWIHLWYVGIPFSILGIFGMIYTYFLYKKLSVKYKEKYQDEILQLANDLIQDSEKSKK